MAVSNRAGKNWARITSTVFFGLDCLVLGLGAIILLWRKESSAYFAAMSASTY